MIVTGAGFSASQQFVKVSSRRRLPIQAAYNLAAVAKIVLIEDDVEIRRLVARALSEQGHDVESASMAMEGLQLTVKDAPISWFWTSAFPISTGPNSSA